MATRAAPADVVAITASTTADATIQVFINVANIIINRVIAEGCSITDSATLIQAEAFLAAHLMITSGAGESGGGKIKQKERFENYSVDYAVATVSGDGVNLTTYGQTANILMGGCLSNLNAEKAAIGFFG